ncbi:MAG: hypothetical protein V5A61_04725 [Haloarculaceae archaeon]
MRGAALRLVAVVCCLGLALTGSLAYATAGTAAGQGDAPNPCVGTMERPADGTTLVSIQGVRFVAGEGFTKPPGMMVAFGPEGEFQYAFNGSARGRWWVYDVDPLRNGNILLASTEPGISVVQEIDPSDGENVWLKRFDGHDGRRPGFHPENVTDAHDVDLINGDELLIADKGTGHHRLLIYNMTSERVTWEWLFANHTDEFPKSGGGPYDRDWTHVNDVDKVGPGKYMASVRNFDRVIVVDRESKAIDLSLGADDDYRFMNEQHNPQYLETEAGDPTILVADSLNDRVVEWTRQDGEWIRTWELVGGGLDEPRDADRLPNGNTLVVDRKGHRTMEVAPNGTVVWEVYTPWQPYDAERARLGEEPGGPTSADMETSRSVVLTNSAGYDAERIEQCGAALAEFAPSQSGGVLGFLGGSSGSGFDYQGPNATDDGFDGTAASPTDEPDEPDEPAGGPDPLVLAGLVALVAAVAGSVLLVRRG